MNAISCQCATVVALPPWRAQCLVTCEQYVQIQSVVFAILVVRLTFDLLTRHFYFDSQALFYEDTIFATSLLKSLFLSEERLRTTMVILDDIYSTSIARVLIDVLQAVLMGVPEYRIV